MTDSLRWLVWAKTKGAQEGRTSPPEKIERPGVKNDRERYGTGAVSMSEMNEFLGWEAA